ncbi:Chl4p [Ascoidea rubescens DSM 1968]|uniref:CHL4-domain-containing protein n=1 Tax=Ascoidea rubescens DSM 1968 TaxID=1344418 RepID=A0A1D2VCL1_9ASCO|nr:CHL4-domain-containing protein [Ascoidea rubescens DSM 1968]ODV59464.1 CHL4-domain-containing protein [Ascoidea rubescens DSM 1968]
MVLSNDFNKINFKINDNINQSNILNLESIFILNGISRFSNSLSKWSGYADNSIDILPFQNPENHMLFNKILIDDNQDEILDENQDSNNTADNDKFDKDKQLETIRKVALLKFKGSQVLKSQRLYEDIRPLKKRKVSSNNKINDESRNYDKNEFSTITPIQYGEYIIKEKNFNNIENDIGDNINSKVSFKIKLKGNDIFAGLHELATKGVVNPYKTPGWLTGEEGNKFGIIEEGVFSSIHDDTEVITDLI